MLAQFAQNTPAASKRNTTSMTRMKWSTPSTWNKWPKEKEWTKSLKWPSMRSFNSQVIKLKKELSKIN
jgi:hypothetical protein